MPRILHRSRIKLEIHGRLCGTSILLYTLYEAKAEAQCVKTRSKCNGIQLVKLETHTHTRTRTLISNSCTNMNIYMNILRRSWRSMRRKKKRKKISAFNIPFSFVWDSIVLWYVQFVSSFEFATESCQTFSFIQIGHVHTTKTSIINVYCAYHFCWCR